MDKSLKAYASCIGLDGDFSLLRDFFGLTSVPPWSNALQVDENPYLPSSLSLATQMKRLRRPFFNIRAISLDGIESSANVRSQIDCAIQLTREIYAKAEFGVGRVHRTSLAPGDAPESISVSDLVDRYDWEGNAIEVFFFLGNFTRSSTTAGETPPTGDGVTVRLGSTFLGTGRSTAHELGHFLIRFDDEHNIIDKGLAVLRSGHRNNPLNLMCQSSKAATIPPPGSGLLDIVSGAQLDWAQRDAIKKSQWVRDSCFPLSIEDLETPDAGYEDPSTGTGSEDPYRSYDTSG